MQGPGIIQKVGIEEIKSKWTGGSLAQEIEECLGRNYSGDSRTIGMGERIMYPSLKISMQGTELKGEYSSFAYVLQASQTCLAEF